jgi:hypothetical protein
MDLQKPAELIAQLSLWVEDAFSHKQKDEFKVAKERLETINEIYRKFSQLGIQPNEELKTEKEKLEVILGDTSVIEEVLDDLRKQLMSLSDRIKQHLRFKKSSMASTSRSVNDGIIPAILEVIAKNQNGTSLKDIREATGLGERQINNALYKLKYRNQIASLERGCYIVLNHTNEGDSLKLDGSEHNGEE